MPKHRKEFPGADGAEQCVLAACEAFSPKRARGAFKYCGYCVQEPLSEEELRALVLVLDLV